MGWIRGGTYETGGTTEPHGQPDAFRHWMQKYKAFQESIATSQIECPEAPFSAWKAG